MPLVDLFLISLPASSVGGGRGRFDPPGPSIQPADTQLVDYEADLDDWDGSGMLMLADPWFLASEPFIAAVQATGLTGLRVGAIANVAFSEEFRQLVELGEMIRPIPPVFRIAAPEREVRINGADGGLRAEADDLTYAGWGGEDFSSSRWGVVLTERALEVVRTFAARDLALWRLRPA